MGTAFSSDSVPRVGAMGRLREDMKLYKLVDMHGGGELIPWMRYAERSGDTSIIDAFIDVKVRDFLMNQGKGKLVAITELVKMRNKERNAMLGAFSRKKGKGKSGPNILDDFNQEGENVGDLKKALKLLDGGGKGGKTESKYREICWKLDERGSMGEHLLGVCLLNGSDIHNKLALKLIEAFPNLVNDINVSEDYYGLSPLHQAVVNQDVRLVAILLKLGADVNQRCYGAYFCADDQKASRTDSLEHEYVELSQKTNYTGQMYFGEYPLSFAACMNHPDCFRLLIAYKANPNAKDTNGNTVLHLCVIHENMRMLRLAIEKGANWRIANNQKMTPLTLAAKLAKKELFLEMLELDSETVWDYADASRTSYPLGMIDTINEDNGDLNDDSVLSLVVHGTTEDHLILLDGLLDELLNAKWETFAKKEWMKSTAAFVVYYAFFFMAFMNRPFSMTTEVETNGFITSAGTIRAAGNFTYDSFDTRCHLLDYGDLPWYQGYFRLACELFVIGGVLFQIVQDVREIRQIGRQKWINIYKAFPAKVLYKISWVLVILMIPTRFLCYTSVDFLAIDNYLALLSVPLTTVHFLYYCRAIKFVGPFVLMIYTIIATDLSRFFIIYGIFLLGFSQSFYMIFFSCEAAARVTDLPPAASEAGEWTDIMEQPPESFVRTFIMTVGEFMTLYGKLNLCPLPVTMIIGKVVFLIYCLFVSMLQLNLVIAMMTRTYELISSTTNEYKRQWAQVILMLEVGVSPKKRREYMIKYSIPTGTNKSIRSFVMSKKIDPNNLPEFEKLRRLEKVEKIIEEKKMLRKKKKLEMDYRNGLIMPRPKTGYNSILSEVD